MVNEELEAGGEWVIRVFEKWRLGRRVIFLMIITIITVVTLSVIFYGYVSEYVFQTPKVYYNISVIGEGDVKPTGLIGKSTGSTLIIKAEPSEGWIFVGWLVNGSLKPPTKFYIIQARGNTTVVVIFKKKG